MIRNCRLILLILIRRLWEADFNPLRKIFRDTPVDATKNEILLACILMFAVAPAIAAYLFYVILFWVIKKPDKSEKPDC